ncbi:MAG: hypothetical protein BMS9Abin32_002 [Gammaproteobacteria bacterium]|nr:MAG: hypothetical protein BMS9Abin32_002 [Gammaproteobacteria bacterium]
MTTGSYCKTRMCQAAACVILATALQSGAAAQNHEYTVTVDDSLSRLFVEARFGAVIDAVTARSGKAGKYLIDVRGCNDSRRIRMRNRRMMLPDAGSTCLNYTVDLAGAAAEYHSSRMLAAGNIVVSPSLWLWRPEISSTSTLRIHFRLPDGVAVSTPWPADGARPDTFRLGKSPQSSAAPVVFGDFYYEEIAVPGSRLQVAMLNGKDPLNHAAIARWLRAAATDVSLAYGRFPNPSPQVVVVPVGDERSNSAVPFGRVIRDGGETVELFVNQHMPLEAFLNDWTATHEFSHLMLPYVDRKHRWISEGFAQYYQNVLLARSGTYTDLQAWQKLYEGFERGRRSHPELSPNEAADRGVKNALMKVYWSGAAFALLADVRLREQSAGRESLDAVLGRFQACCLPSKRIWSGPELFSRLDTLTDTPVFMALYRRYADTAGFPDASVILQRLGLSVANGKVRSRRSAELQEVRQSITQTDAATAAWRLQLAASDAQ